MWWTIFAVTLLAGIVSGCTATQRYDTKGDIRLSSVRYGEDNVGFIYQEESFYIDLKQTVGKSLMTVTFSDDSIRVFNMSGLWIGDEETVAFNFVRVDDATHLYDFNEGPFRNISPDMFKSGHLEIFINGIDPDGNILYQKLKAS